MTKKTNPALTKREWHTHRMWEAGKMIGGKLPGPDPYQMRPENRHAIAARMLDGQPFGFTRNDVDFLRSFSAHMDDIAEGPMLASLADRLEALLPPEDD